MWSFLEEEVHKHAVRLFRLLCTINAVLVTIVTITDRILNSSSDMNHDYSSCLHFLGSVWYWIWLHAWTL